MCDNPDPEPPSAEAVIASVKAELNEIKLAVAALTPPPDLPGHRWPAAMAALSAFFSSGVFFMVVGALLLWCAYGTMGGTHSSFSFVLVVVGIAVLLFGTGTQGSGQMANDAATVKYKVAIAGGAGVLAFCVGAGIVYFADPIKGAFQIEKRYVRYVLKSADENFADLSNYAALATVDGEQVPALTRGGHIEVYVPYFISRKEVEIVGTARLHSVKELTGQMKTVPPTVFRLTIPANHGIPTADGGYDFPIYAEVMPVKIREEVQPNVELLDQEQVKTKGGGAPPSADIAPS